MSVSVISCLPKGFGIVRNFRGAGSFKLYQKGNSYVCSAIDPWDRRSIRYIKIDASREELKKRVDGTLGFTRDESHEFQYRVAKVCRVMNGKSSWINSLSSGEISMVFWANHIAGWVNKRKWDCQSDLFYSLAQILYVCCGILVRKAMIEKLKFEYPFHKVRDVLKDAADPFSP
jgi:hypothetical protein